jgi:hypothetical protein
MTEYTANSKGRVFLYHLGRKQVLWDTPVKPGDKVRFSTTYLLVGSPAFVYPSDGPERLLVAFEGEKQRYPVTVLEGKPEQHSTLYIYLVPCSAQTSMP